MILRNIYDKVNAMIYTDKLENKYPLMFIPKVDSNLTLYDY